MVWHVAAGCDLHAEEADGDGADALDDEGQPQLGRVRGVRRNEVPARCRELSATNARWIDRMFFGIQRESK